MEIMDEYKGRYFYHFTHISNIESIVENGILSTNEKNEKKILHMDLANENIQTRRSQMSVPCHPFGKIHDYVPFYFASTNPMLLGVLNKKNIDQPLVVFLAISIDKLIEDGVIFTDASANTSAPPNFYSDPQKLDELSWDLIDSTKWARGTDQELHSRMAEVLVYKKVPVDWIDSFIVFDDFCKSEINKIYSKYNLKKPKISYSPFNSRHFYFTKYFWENREYESLITGPLHLRDLYMGLIERVEDSRKNLVIVNPAFKDINNALTKISNNFCVLAELEGIYELETDNKVHTQNVSDHTIQVVKNLKNIDLYKKLSRHDKSIMEISAYLHDIGKGPKSKWNDGIQRAYPDHPADAIPMLERILLEEFGTITDYEIRKICLLVIYHDIIGDILGKERSKKELLDLGIDKKEFSMLIAISLADIEAINSSWFLSVKRKLPSFINEISKEL